MKYGELRGRLRALLFGESIFKENCEELKTLTDSALIDIATRVAPFALISSDIRKHTPLRYINKNQFVRYPKKIVDDNTEIEIDDALHTALTYRLASFIANENKRMFYEKAYRVELDRFIFANFNATRS